MTAQSSIGQRGRLIILLLYLAGLLVASWTALGSWIPPTSEKGIWFYAALAALLLGSLLVTPFFTTPANAISYAVASLVTLLAVNAWGVPSTSGFDRFTWSAAMFYVVLVLVAGILAISLKDSPRPLAQKAARSALLLADAAGSPRAVFSAVFLFALITYHRSDPREYLIISLAWALFVGLRPLETIANLWRRWRIVWVTKQDLTRLGEVVGHEAPGLVLIREDPDSSARFGDMVFARTESGKPGLVIALDHVGFASGRWLRAIHLKTATFDTAALHDASVVRAISEGSAFAAAAGSVASESSGLVEDTNRRLIGLVASDTNIGQLQIELVRADLDLQEGSLVEVEIKGRRVLYQVIKGLTKEEVLQEKNTRGFVRAHAKKIGFWNNDRRSFDPVPWLPQPNQAVLLVHPKQEAVEKDAIGHFPGTSFPVSIDPHLLVTHNAAILGILGVGKSYLALELVERMISAGIKVVCLDLTNQYAEELGSFLDPAAETAARDELERIGPAGKTNVKKNVEEGGSVREFTAKMKEQLGVFLASANPRKLRILNPAQFEVWRQDSRPYGNEASMATLTPTEITRIITESTLDVLQSQGMTGQARCCVVYEEAHSLIPEWNAVASDGDKTATNGTAKAILQGRKFGLGCLVITQRTANVTKSILNQCNTVFGLRVFDATGMEFLKNYIGEDYAGVLSTLEDRHAVVFGRASSCRDPVLSRLNDRADFIRKFREPKPSSDGTGANP
ncbi:MAG: ATP-binding protein [Candidatus Rokuibacteriota bacterium]